MAGFHGLPRAQLTFLLRYRARHLARIEFTGVLIKRAKCCQNRSRGAAYRRAPPAGAPGALCRRRRRGPDTQSVACPPLAAGPPRSLWAGSHHFLCARMLAARRTSSAGAKVACQLVANANWRSMANATTARTCRLARASLSHFLKLTANEFCGRLAANTNTHTHDRVGVSFAQLLCNAEAAPPPHNEPARYRMSRAPSR